MKTDIPPASSANSVPVFPAEIEAGLSEAVSGKNRLAWASAARIASDRAVTRFRAPPFPRGIATARTREEDRFDLWPLETVLVSTGINLNDDVFDPAETWTARKSPEDKPFNHEHACDDIIGHITDCRAVDDSFAPLDDSLPVDRLPERFHVVTGAVLYRRWEDPSLQQRMDAIVAEISSPETNAWFVSMEALFFGFDYLLIPGPHASDASSKAGARVVARDDSTAFLTKHLRAYGGTGLWKESRVYRLLRRIVFSGKGLVRNPANPGSVILPSSGGGTSAASVPGLAPPTAPPTAPATAPPTAPVSGDTAFPLCGRIEPFPEGVFREYSAKSGYGLPKRETETTTTEANAGMSDTNHDSDTNTREFRDRIVRLEERLSVLDSAKTAAEQKLASVIAEAGDWKSKYEDLAARHSKLESDFAEIVRARTRAERTSLVVAKLRLEEADATAMAEKLSGLSDEDFRAHVDFLVARVESTTAKPAATATATATTTPAKPTRSPAVSASVLSDPRIVPTDRGTVASPGSGGAAGLGVSVDSDDEARKRIASTRASIRRYIASRFGMEEDEDDVELDETAE